MEVKAISQMEIRGHEQVTYFYYPRVGLKAIVAIHNTALGPALGGCRLRLYDNETQALDDVLRLSEGMTYKSSLAGLNLGGGKSCIIRDPLLKDGRKELFLQFARCLNDLNGRYITAEDMGTNVEDMMVMREVTRFATGYPIEKGGSGDPSPWTARGVFNAMRAACERRFKTKDMKGRRVAVQGVGHVGLILTKLLKEAGAHIIVCDTNKDSLEKAVKHYGVEVVPHETIYSIACDVYAPCAIGQTVNSETIKQLKCRIISGAANNQLSDASVYPLLEGKNIMYCPDFVINSGGVISVGAEFNEGGWSEKWVSDKVHSINSTVHRVLDESEKRKKFTEIVALELAKERVHEAEERKLRERR